MPYLRATKPSITTSILMMVSILMSSSSTTAQDAEVANQIKIGDSYTMDVPDGWRKREPRSRIIEHEFSIKAVKGDDTDGRVTMMGAGGSVEANIDRWIGQFSQPDGGATKERAKTSERKIAGQTVHLVDIAGTFQDKPKGPFGPSVERLNYRMLGAVIVTEMGGSYFVKLYGPAQTVAANETAFTKLVDSLRAVD